MAKKVKKKPMAAAISEDIDDLNKDDKLELIQHEFKLAKKAQPDYKKETAELRTYTVDLPENPDIADLSKINKLYAIAQSFSSR